MALGSFSLKDVILVDSRLVSSSSSSVRAEENVASDKPKPVRVLTDQLGQVPVSADSITWSMSASRL